MGGGLADHERGQNQSLTNLSKMTKIQNMTIPIVFSHQKLKDDIFAEERSIWEEISQVNKSKDENTEYVVQENVSKRSIESPIRPISPSSLSYQSETKLMIMMKLKSVPRLMELKKMMSLRVSQQLQKKSFESLKKFSGFDKVEKMFFNEKKPLGVKLIRRKVVNSESVEDYTVKLDEWDLSHAKGTMLDSPNISQNFSS